MPVSESFQPVPCTVPWAWKKSHCWRISEGNMYPLHTFCDHCIRPWDRLWQRQTSNPEWSPSHNGGLLPESRPGWKRCSSSQGRYLLQLLQYLQIQKKKKHVSCNEELCAIKTMEKRKWFSAILTMMFPTIEILPICAVTFTVVSAGVIPVSLHIPQEQPSAVHLLQDQSSEELKETTFDVEVKTQIKMDLIFSIPSQPATTTGKEYCR